MKNVRHFASGISNRISFNIPSNEMSPLCYIIAQVYQVPSHYLNQCRQGSPAHKCVTQPHRVKPPYIHYTIPKNVTIGLYNSSCLSGAKPLSKPMLTRLTGA